MLTENMPRVADKWHVVFISEQRDFDAPDTGRGWSFTADAFCLWNESIVAMFLLPPREPHDRSQAHDRSVKDMMSLVDFRFESSSPAEVVNRVCVARGRRGQDAQSLSGGNVLGFPFKWVM